MIDKGHLQTGDIRYDQRHTVAKMKTIDLKTLRLLSSPATFDEAEKYLRTHKAKIEFAENETVKKYLRKQKEKKKFAKNETVKPSVVLNGQTYKVIIRKNEERNFDTSCD